VGRGLPGGSESLETEVPILLDPTEPAPPKNSRGCRGGGSWLVVWLGRWGGMKKSLLRGGRKEMTCAATGKDARTG